MAERSYEFGRVDLVQADAIGVPGQRRFRLRARAGGQYALVWVEREQIQALGLALEQLLTQVQVQYHQRPVKADPGGPLDDFPMTPTVEFTAGRIGLGYDSEHDLAVLELTDIEQNLADQEEAAERAAEAVTLVIRFSRGQAAALRDQCEATLAAGRPRCHLCGAPMAPDGSHFCIRANGHAHGA
jgi:uncharacterized repeat protein (TIGR03847 family)